MRKQAAPSGGVRQNTKGPNLNGASNVARQIGTEVCVLAPVLLTI